MKLFFASIFVLVLGMTLFFERTLEASSPIECHSYVVKRKMYSSLVRHPDHPGQRYRTFQAIMQALREEYTQAHAPCHARVDLLWRSEERVATAHDPNPTIGENRIVGTYFEVKLRITVCCGPDDIPAFP